MTNDTPNTKEPKDTALRQQRMRAWQPILDPTYVIIAFFVIGAIFVPVGFKIQSLSNSINEHEIEYDRYDDTNRTLPCGINDTANANKTCRISVDIDEDMTSPILIYYQIDNFHQNHRKYEQSRDDYQLLGSLTQTSVEEEKCKPLHKLGNIKINPCGLIANTFFNDVIRLDSVTISETNGTDKTNNTNSSSNSSSNSSNSSNSSSNITSDNNTTNYNNTGSNDTLTTTTLPLEMIETGIAWQSDLDYKFSQPDTFRTEPCSTPCSNCTCDGQTWGKGSSRPCPYIDPLDDTKCHKFHYPDDENTQYLYETYPDIISPMEGVTNEHFVVWMRTAALPKFRKLYGWLDADLKKGTRLDFEIWANWEVRSFEGSKSLVVTDTNVFGGKNDYLGRFFYGVGFVCLGLGVAFGVKHWFFPRKLGDRRYLRFKED